MARLIKRLPHKQKILRSDPQNPCEKLWRHHGPVSLALSALDGEWILEDAPHPHLLASLAKSVSSDTSGKIKVSSGSPQVPCLLAPHTRTHLHMLTHEGWRRERTKSLAWEVGNRVVQRSAWRKGTEETCSHRPNSWVLSARPRGVCSEAWPGVVAKVRPRT